MRTLAAIAPALLLAIGSGATPSPAAAAPVQATAAGASTKAAKAQAAKRQPGMAKVGAGTYAPIYPPTPEESRIPMEAFELDRYPVTNGEFLAFVRATPNWRKGRVSRIFADPRYLEHWAGPTELGPDVDPDAPVTRVSWFAARAYCEAQGKRLPTENEWEYAASASATDPDGKKDPAFVQMLLDWYSKPTPKKLPAVGGGEPNYWGIHDLHGLVWEWVVDYGSTMVTSDSREDGDPDKMRFCGASAINAGDKEDYAGFMRYAFRSSLQGGYTVGNLGFRCAR